MRTIDGLTVTIPEITGVDIEQVQSQLGIDGAAIANLDQVPHYYSKAMRLAGEGHITRPNRRVVIYRAQTGNQLPTEREDLEDLLRWHHAELGILAGQDILVPPSFTAIVESDGQAPRLYTVARTLTSPDMYDRLVTRPESMRTHTSIRRQRPVVELAQALLGYYTDEQRPAGQAVIVGLKDPAAYTLVRGRPALRQGSMPIPATPGAPERGISSELWALGNWVNNDLRETPETLSLLEAIARARQ